MSFRRVNRSKKVPGVKLRPAAPNTRRDLRTPDSTYQRSSGLDSDEDTSRVDLCPRPFKGFVLCATGISDKVSDCMLLWLAQAPEGCRATNLDSNGRVQGTLKSSEPGSRTWTSLFKLALELGAQSVSDFTDRVTHLIAEEPGSPKYRFALNSRIAIMHPSWIVESHKIWLRGDDIDVAQSIKDHRLPPFLGVVLCVSGMDDVERRLEVNRELTDAGGTYVKQIIRPVRVTHLICANTSEGETDKVHYANKFNQLGEANIRIVWEDWFWDSLKFGGRFDEEAYLVSNPRPPPRVLPEDTTPPPPSSSVPGHDPSGLSSEIQNAETSAAGRAKYANDGDEEEIASVKRVPEVTLHLWQSILKPRGFEVQEGRLVRSPSKSQSQRAAEQQAHRHREPSPSRLRVPGKTLLLRGTLRVGAGAGDEEDRKGPKSALLSSSLARARSFAPMPDPQHASTPFQRAQTTGSRTSSFLQRSVGSVRAAGGMPSNVPIASTSAIAGPSTGRGGNPVPDEQEREPIASSASEDLTENGRVMFSGLRFRALGEARCASVRKAIESAGGRWMGPHDDEDADIVVVRLVNGSSLFAAETDGGERAKYRTECWLERCLFEERVCLLEEHVAFTPLRAVLPIRGAEQIILSCSGLDEAEKCLVERLCRALGIALVPVFSRRTTYLLCPSGAGAKADKARELGTPIVDMSWLTAIANTGEIPNPAAPAAKEQDPLLDLALLSQRRQVPGQDGDEWMASQPPATIPPKADAKGKGKATDTMIDITNAHADNPQPRSQSLSYYDPAASNEPRPGQADQIETFGLPGLLLGSSEPTPSPNPPATPRHPARTPPNPDSGLPATQPAQEEGGSVSIPSRVYEDRIPSSESPSPMRMPGMPTPQDSAPAPRTPAKPARQATVVLQTRLTTLLGKRPNEEDEEDEREREREREREETLSAKKLQAHDSRLGKRLKPLQRTRSNMSCTDLLGTPGQSPASVFAAAASPVPPPEPDLLPQLPDTHVSAKKARRASSSGDEAEGSFVGAETNESLRVAYADPHQNGELDRLKYLFNPEDGVQRKEGWEMDLDVEKEMTLPQLTAATTVHEKLQLQRSKMAHNHSHGGGCHDESDDHDHDHGLPEDVGYRDNLFSRIDRANVVALNAEEPGKGPEVIKPWDQRLDEDSYLESDADDQMIIRIPFTGAVKLRALLLKTGPGEQTAAKLSLFPNMEHLDFSDLEDKKPVQEFTIPQGRDVGEYHVMPAKFPNVTSMTLFFPASQGADTTRIYYVGFLGQWSERKFEPVLTVYESKPNLADHGKIQGLNENWTAPGT
ncbi:hypothetical protein LXA43DRAFT_1186179 [Ganoderma leucocontextum]|nr:hypothetical protein LXA43DRAFT_1186179 [Ganoderma leucocontextum]